MKTLHYSTVTGDGHDNSYLNQTLQGQNENAANNLTIYEVNPEDVYNVNDVVSKIKAAFIYHLKNQPQKCTAVLNELWEDENSGAAQELDNIITNIAKELVDDIPAADPRWEDQINPENYALGSSASMQIIQQLKEKNRAFNHFMEFLHASQLWNKVSV